MVTVVMANDRLSTDALRKGTSRSTQLRAIFPLSDYSGLARGISAGRRSQTLRCCGLEEGPRVELAGRECRVLLLTSPRGAEQTGAAAAG